jgi:ribosomal protein L31
MRITLATPALRSTRLPVTQSISSRPASSSSTWPSRTHLRKPPTIPAPVPAVYAQTVVLSDGSTFTAHTTAPTPSIIRLTRDVTNNPLWAPGTDRRGLADGSEEGRVGKFRRRFEGLSTGGEEESEGEGKGTGTSAKEFGEGDFDWMGEGAKEEKLVVKEAPTGKGKGGKK